MYYLVTCITSKYQFNTIFIIKLNLIITLQFNIKQPRPRKIAYRPSEHEVSSNLQYDTIFLFLIAYNATVIFSVNFCIVGSNDPNLLSVTLLQ